MSDTGASQGVFRGYLTLGSIVNLGAIIAATVGATLYISGISAKVDLLTYKVEVLEHEIHDGHTHSQADVPAPG